MYFLYAMHQMRYHLFSELRIHSWQTITLNASFLIKSVRKTHDDWFYLNQIAKIQNNDLFFHIHFEKFFDFSLHKSKYMNASIFYFFYITVYYSYVDYHVQHISGTPSWFWGLSPFGTPFHIIISKTMDLRSSWVVMLFQNKT